MQHRLVKITSQEAKRRITGRTDPNFPRTVRPNPDFPRVGESVRRAQTGAATSNRAVHNSVSLGTPVYGGSQVSSGRPDRWASQGVARQVRPGQVPGRPDRRCHSKKIPGIKRPMPNDVLYHYYSRLHTYRCIVYALSRQRR